MGTSQQLVAIDSFSYRWLLNLNKSSFDALDDAYTHFDDTQDEGLGCCFIEMDPKTERAVADDQDFYFNLPNSQPLAIVHADQLFSNGFLMPLRFLSTAPKTVEQDSASSSFSSSFSVSARDCRLDSILAARRHPSLTPSSAFYQSCRRSSKRVLHKLLRFLRPLYRKVMRGRRFALHEKRDASSSLTSPSKVSMNLALDSQVENSIWEAVLHCKKSMVD